jgi:hypothetical protein
MARRRTSSGVGFRNPPRSTRFKPGKSGNPKGRPKGSRNFDTALAKELRTRVTITENGRQRRATKQTAIIKQLTNKAAGGDMKATQTIIKASQPDEQFADSDHPFAVFDSAEDRLVMAEIVERIRSMESAPPAVPDKSQNTSSKPQRMDKK